VILTRATRALLAHTATNFADACEKRAAALWISWVGRACRVLVVICVAASHALAWRVCSLSDSDGCSSGGIRSITSLCRLLPLFGSLWLLRSCRRFRFLGWWRRVIWILRLNAEATAADAARLVGANHFFALWTIVCCSVGFKVMLSRYFAPLPSIPPVVCAP